MAGASHTLAPSAILDSVSGSRYRRRPTAANACCGVLAQLAPLFGISSGSEGHNCDTNANTLSKRPRCEFPTPTARAYQSCYAAGVSSVWRMCVAECLPASQRRSICVCALCCCCCCCCVCLDTDDERVKSGPVEVLALLPWSAGIRVRETSPGTPSDSSRRSPLPLTLTTILPNAYLCRARRRHATRRCGAVAADQEQSRRRAASARVRAMARWDPISLVNRGRAAGCVHVARGSKPRGPAAQTQICGPQMPFWCQETSR